jgi:hypothetical protein
MIVLICFCPLLLLLLLLLLLTFLKCNEDVMPSTRATSSTSAERTAKRREERRRKRQRENERRLLLETKGPDIEKLRRGIAKIYTMRKKDPSDQSYESFVVFEARKLLALSTFLRGQITKCYYHNALLCDIHRKLIGYVVIPNWKIMRMIATLSKGKILSLGSGNAAFEACLLRFILAVRSCIICTDISVDDNAFMPVIKMDNVSAVKRFGSDTNTCLICWPDLNESHTLEALKVRNMPFPCIIYVGEPRGGCCGTNELFDYLEEFYTLRKCISIKSFPNSGDAVCIYHLKKIVDR